MNSLQRQLSWSLSIGLVAIFSLFWLITSYSVHHLSEDYLVMRLQHDTDNLKKAFRLQNNQLSLQQDELDPIFLRAESGHYFVVMDAQGKRINSPSLEDFELQIKPLHKDEVSVYETEGPLSRHVLVRLSLIELDGQKFQVAVAEDHGEYEQAIHQLDWILGGLSLIGLIGIWLWQQTILRRGFDSLTPIRQALLNAPHQGIPAHINVPREIAPLVNTLNQTLHQLHERLARSRQRTGNLAHSLKTPLNLIYQQLDSAEINENLRQQLKEQAQRMNQLIDRELKKARLAGGDLHSQTLRLPQDIDALVQGFSKLYRDKNIAFQITLPPPGLVLTMDKEDGYELLGNLLDNASKWCVSRVALSIKLQQQDLVIDIEDDGVGVESAELERLKQRGQRLDENQPGYGLGLSIVDEIVQIYQGEWSLQPSATLGGLQVSMRLPGLVVSKD